ncbi:hypothetical protein PMAYCL1PPCAC_18591, partial [Pristionchus mayeri]
EEMEEGVVVEKSDTHAVVWVNRLSRPIPADLSLSKSTLNIGSAVYVTLYNLEEITILNERSATARVTLKGNDLKMLVNLIFPPRKLLSKCGLKLYSPSVGLISVNESWRALFDMAAEKKAAVYETTIQWCGKSREFVLAASQQMFPLQDVSPFPTYLSILKESPWAELVKSPKRAEEVLQYIMDDTIPSESSDDENIVETASDFVKMGVIYKELVNNEWEVFILDCEDRRDQWTRVSDRRMTNRKKRPAVGKFIEIHLKPNVNNNKEEWCVVDPDDSVIPRQYLAMLLLDVAVRVEKIVRIGDRMITRLHNNRILDVYDYDGVLGRVERGEVIRVLIKWIRIDPSKTYARSEWVVHGYGEGEAVVRSDFRRRREIDRALYEFGFIEYASRRDCKENKALRNYKRLLRESLEEDRRENEKKEKKTEPLVQEELESMCHKEGIEADKERRETKREEEEFLRQMELNNMDDEDSEIEAVSNATLSSISPPTTLERPGLPPFGQSVTRRKESSSDSTHSSHSQNATIRRDLPSFGQDLNISKEWRSDSSQSSILTQTTVIEICPSKGNVSKSKTKSSQSKDSGLGSARSSSSERERRALAVIRRMEILVRRNGILRKMIDEKDSDLIDDLFYVIDEYKY